ncbi:MAG TPA: protein kinase [Kineosporiaceae bacterium]
MPHCIPAVLAAPAAALRDGDPRQLGGHQLIGRLDRGWGVVYLGTSAAGQPVTVRVLDARWVTGPAGRSALVRALLAARRTAGVSWSARVLEVQPDGDPPYIVSEYVEGTSVRRLVTSLGPFRGPDLDRLADDSLSALAALHRAGVAHGTLTPDAIVLGPEGLRLYDVGIARFIGAGLPALDPADGGWWYIDPRILSGQPMDAAADVFAWAATLVFAAQGRAPFRAPTLEAFVRQVQWADADLVGLPPAFHDVLLRCLADDPARRPRPAEVRDELRKVHGLR